MIRSKYCSQSLKWIFEAPENAKARMFTNGRCFSIG